jgi:glycolate oxidase FAD binding subunit
MAAVSPSTGLKPSDAAELAALLGADSRPLEPIGLGSKRAIGRPVEAEPLDLSALAGVVDYRPAELVLTAGAATPLAAIETLLAENGHRLAFEPPDLSALLGADSQSPQSIGGVLATNLSGSRRIAAGAARDHFLGVTAVNGRGATFSAGGKVVKNVTGYDLPKLLAGSWGSLAVMTEVTLKVVPQAETELTLIVPDAEPAAAVATLSAALGSPHEVSSAAFDPWRGSALRLEGIAASVAARRSALLQDLGDPEVEQLEAGASRTFWQHAAAAAALADWPVVWRLSVPPSDAPRVVEAIGPERYLLDWGGGLIWAAFDTADASRVRGALRDGHAMLIKAPAATRACRQHPPSAAMRDVLERVRAAFDPDGRLNPGRMD